MSDSFTTLIVFLLIVFLGTGISVAEDYYSGIEKKLPEATDPSGEVNEVTRADKIRWANQREDISQKNWSFGKLKPASNIDQFFTLKKRYRDNLERTGEYYGYHAKLDSELNQVKKEGVNAIFNNFTWLSSLLEKDKEKASGVDVAYSQLASYSQPLRRSDWLNVSVFPSVITCNNFHTYPDWFVEKHPDIFMKDARGNKVALNFEGNKPDKKGLYVNNFNHPVLNKLKRKTAAAEVSLFGNKENLKAWKIDGESLYFAQGGNVYNYNTVLTDYSKGAVKHFRSWLKLKYKDIEALNSAWNSNFNSFAEVEPPSGQDKTRSDLDWNTFRIWALVEYVNDQYVVFKTLDPSRYSFSWVHDVGLWGKSLLTTGLSQYAYSYAGDGIHPSYIQRPGKTDYGAQYYEVVSSFGKPVLTSEMSYHPRPWPSWAIRKQMYEALGLGVWGIGLCQWTPQGTGDLNWSIKGTEGEKEVREILKEFKSFVPFLKNMWSVNTNLRLFVSEPNWIFNGWLNEWEQIQTHLLKRDLPKRYVFDRQLQEKSIAFPEVMVSIDNSIIRQDVYKELMNYVKSGGILVISEDFYQYDENMSKTNWDLDQFKKVESAQKQNISYQIYNSGAGQIIKFTGDYKAKMTDVMFSLLKKRGINLKPVQIKDLDGSPELDLSSFLLSDGVNRAVVLINRTEKKITSSISLRNDILPHPPYKVKELVDMKTETKAFTPEDSLTISLPARGTAVLYFSRATDKEELKSKIDSIKKGWEKLEQKGIKPRGKDTVENIQNNLKPEQMDKHYARIKKIMDYFYVLPEKQKINITKGSRKILEVKVLDFKGNPVTGCAVDTRVTPAGLDTRLQWKEVGAGNYKVLIDDLDIPPIYNYSQKKYIRYQGESWLEIDVRGKKEEGYETVKLNFK